MGRQDVRLNNMENIEQKIREKNKLLPSYYYFNEGSADEKGKFLSVLMS